MTREDLALSLVTGLAIVAIVLVLVTAPVVHGVEGPVTTTTTVCVDDWHPTTGEDCPKGPI